MSLHPSVHDTPLKRYFAPSAVTTPPAARTLEDPDEDPPEVNRLRSHRPSLRDASYIEKTNTVALSHKFSTDPSSFCAALSALRRRRDQFAIWRTLLTVDYTPDLPTVTNPTVTDLDLLQHLHTVPYAVSLDAAKALWLPSSDPQSIDSLVLDPREDLFARKTLATLLLSSCTTDFASWLQQSLVNKPILINDGPLLWALIVWRIFPTAVLYSQHVEKLIKSITLSAHKNVLPNFTCAVREYTLFIPETIIAQSAVLHVLDQLSCHPHSVIRDHFRNINTHYLIGVLPPRKLTDYLSEADRLSTAVTSGAFPSLSNTPSATDDKLLALASLVETHQGSLTKLYSLFTKQKTSTDDPRNERRRLDRDAIAKLPKPPFYNTTPSDPNEVKSFNDKPWYYCAECGRWTTSHGPKHPTRKHQPRGNGRPTPSGKDGNPFKKAVTFQKRALAAAAKSTDLKELLLLAAKASSQL
jgi:hypothetical protein